MTAPSLTIKGLSVDYQGRRRPVSPAGELAFGASRTATSHERGTPAQRRAAYDDWSDRLRSAVAVTRGGPR